MNRSMIATALILTAATANAQTPYAGMQIADGITSSRHHHVEPANVTGGAVSSPLTDWVDHRSRPSAGHVAATNEEPSPFPNAGDGSSPHEMGGIASGSASTGSGSGHNPR
jgi:hypothetical protein